MAYKALYRSYRPSVFSEVAGQKYIIKTLKNSLVTGRTTHAYVFSGPRGIGKTTIARILAKALNCENLEDGEPCNKCASCMSIINGETADIYEFDAATNTGVDDIRNILEKINYLPGNLRKKVYIIDEVHMLSIWAFNALLKTLEEPPAHVVFILATTEPHKIPMTILSRCQRFDFKPLTINQITQKLKEIVEVEKIEIEDEALDIIAEVSDGGMRDAISIVDQVNAYKNGLITVEDVDNVTGRIPNQMLISLLASFDQGDATVSIKIVDELLEKGKETSRLIRSLLQLCRDILLYQSVDIKDSYKLIFDNPDFQQLANTIDKKKIFYYTDVLNDVLNKIKYSVSQKIYLEIGIIKMVNIDLSNYKNRENTTYNDSNNQDITALEESINRINAKLNNLESLYNKENITDFKDEATGKLKFLEDIISKFSVFPSNLEERIELLEEKEINQTPFDTKYIDDINNQIAIFKEEIEVIKQIPKENNTSEISAQLSLRLDELEEKISIGSNNINTTNEDEYKELEEKIKHLEKAILEIETKENNGLEEFGNNDYNSLEQRVTDIEINAKEIIQKIEELLSKDVPVSESVTFSENAEFEPFELPLNDDETYNPNMSEIDKLNENYLSLLEKVTQFMNEINVTKQEMENTVKLQQQLEEKFNNIKIPNSNDEKIKLLEEQIAGIKEYSLKVGARITEVEEKVKQSLVKIDATKHETLTRKEEVKPIIEEKIIEEKKEEPKKQEPLIVEEKEEKQEIKETPQNDETQRVYNIKTIENVMHQSRDRKNLSERDRVISLWKNMPGQVGSSLVNIAKMLSDGKPAINSGQCIIIVYPNAPICNHLMSDNVHFNAKQVLKAALGREYDFIALPENTWQEKSNEYRSQYYMGIKFPRLKPINNPELKVVSNPKEKTFDQKSKSYIKAEEIFGKNLIKEEDK